MSTNTFLIELAGLANLMAGTSRLSVVAGEPGSGWFININAGMISADLADLETRDPDFCRGLITHEVGHHLITRFAAIFPESRSNVAYHALTNVLEDIRLERYIGIRFPGSVAWGRLYNNELLGLTDARTRERFAEDVIGAFLLGIVNRAWWGSTPDCCHPDAKSAIDEVWPSVERIMLLHPPLQAPLDPEPWHAAYRATDLPLLFASEDAESAPDAMEMATRLAEFSVWQEMFLHILPVFDRLLAKHGSESSYLADRLAEAFQRMLDGLTNQGVPGQRSFQAGGAGKLGGAGEGADAPGPSGPEAYHETAGRHGAEIHRLAAHLAKLAATDGKLKFRGRHASGARVNLRAAVQAEADPRLLDRTWQRPHVPRRPDPLIILAVDASGSMAGEEARATFAGVVILRQACRIARIPLSIVRFGSDAWMLESWADRAADANIGEITSLLNPDGGTNMLEALDIGTNHAAESRHRDPIHLIVSDGEPAGRDEVRARVQSMVDAGEVVLGIGLGPQTANLANIIPGARVEIRPQELPEVLAEMLGEAVGALYA